MPSLPDDPQRLRRLAMDHLDRVREDPQATWQDYEQALEWALLAVLLPAASADPSQRSTARSTPRTTMPELPNPKAASTEPTATCQGCGLPIYRLADGTWNLVYREWDNTRACWPNNAGDHQPAHHHGPAGRAASMSHPSDPTTTATTATTARAMTVRELIQALTIFASSGELPRGLDTPFEVGLTHPEDNTFETYAAIQIDRATGIWPSAGPDRVECRHTTLQLTGEPDHPDAGRYNHHPLTEHPDWEDPR